MALVHGMNINSCLLKGEREKVLCGEFLPFQVTIPLLAYSLSASQIGRCSSQRYGWLVAKSITGPKKARTCTVLCGNTFQSKLVLPLILWACGNFQGCSRAIEKGLEMDSFDTGKRGGCSTQIRKGHNTAWNGIGT